MKEYTVADLIVDLEKVENQKLPLTVSLQCGSLVMSGSIVGADEGKNGVALKSKDVTIKNV